MEDFKQKMSILHTDASIKELEDNLCKKNQLGEPLSVEAIENYEPSSCLIG